MEVLLDDIAAYPTYKINLPDIKSDDKEKLAEVLGAVKESFKKHGINDDNSIIEIAKDEKGNSRIVAILIDGNDVSAQYSAEQLKEDIITNATSKSGVKLPSTATLETGSYSENSKILIEKLKELNKDGLTPEEKKLFWKLAGNFKDMEVSIVTDNPAGSNISTDINLVIVDKTTKKQEIIKL
jgi:hypothetical protein